MQRACLYLRSSKDRSDVSIDAQRRELRELALARGLMVVKEFEDVVVSGKTENRPGWQALLGELKAPQREWTLILALDTSRIARNQWIAHTLRHECKKRDVDLLFAKTPELEGVAGVILPAVLHAMDEVHSMLSREKGLAGMRENVLQGFRAGGRAPWGYRLKRHSTGAVRDGELVTKSTLEPDPAAAPIVQAYLQLRARGMARTRALREAGVTDQSLTGLVGTDWQAMTYAGHTVWNVHFERVDGGHAGGRKRRPRAEWTVKENTHPALITTAEAEAVRRSLETSTLSALLKTAEGRAWQGCRQRTRAGVPVGFYRVGNKHLTAAPLEQAVVARVLSDLRSDHFAEALAFSARQQANGDKDPAKALRAEQQKLARDIDRQMELAPQLKDPAPALRRVDALEAQRRGLTVRIEEADRARAEREELASATPEAIRTMLDGLAAVADQLQGPDLKALLETVVERVQLEPDGDEVTLCYAVAPVATRESMAFPRGFEPLLHP
jgi:site-specific DNA recombinase